MGFRLLEAAVDASTDPGLRPGRFPGCPVWVDRREVLVLDRLPWAPGERADPGRAPGQRDALLASRRRRVVGPAVLGELQQPRLLGRGGAKRSLDLSQRDLSHLPALGG